MVVAARRDEALFKLMAIAESSGTANQTMAAYIASSQPNWWPIRIHKFMLSSAYFGASIIGVSVLETKSKCLRGINHSLVKAPHSSTHTVGIQRRYRD